MAREDLECAAECQFRAADIAHIAIDDAEAVEGERMHRMMLKRRGQRPQRTLEASETMEDHAQDDPRVGRLWVETQRLREIVERSALLTDFAQHRTAGEPRAWIRWLDLSRAREIPKRLRVLAHREQ